MPWIASVTLTVAAALVLAAPTAASDEPAVPKPAALERSSLTWCRDIPEIKADQSLFRDRPIYVGNPPNDKLGKWARKRPGYAGIWIDRDNFGWTVVAFSDDADKRVAEIDRLFPDLGAATVAVAHSKKELNRVNRRIQREAAPLLESWSIGVQPTQNVVFLEAGVLTDEIVAGLEQVIGDDPVCVSGFDPSMLVSDGPQPAAGDGWTLVAHRQSEGPHYRTGLASNEGQLQELWQRAGMDGEVPALDFEREVVAWFAAPHGSTCDLLRLDDIVIDHAASVIRPYIVMPDDPMMCTDDLAGAYQYLVAIERGRLPEAPFTTQLYAEWSDRDRVVIETDLRIPGSVAADDEIYQQKPPKRLTGARSGDIVEVGYRSTYVMDVSCGVRYLGELNDIHWVSDRTKVPKAWRPRVSDGGEIVVSVLLKGGKDPRATARTGGQTIRYEPRRKAPPEPCGG